MDYTTDSILLMNEDSDLSDFEFSVDESSEDELSQSDAGGEGAYTGQIYISYCVHFATNYFFRSCLFAAEIDESPRLCKQRRDDDPKRLTGGILHHQ